MRNIVEVAKQIQDIVPDKYKSVFDFYIEPKNFAYLAPEQMDVIWGKLSRDCNYLLENEIPPAISWKVKMISILIDKPESWVRTHSSNKKEDY